MKSSRRHWRCRLEAIERDIRKLLNQVGSPDLVAQDLIKRWRMQVYSSDQQKAIAQFLWDCGLQQRLLGEIQRLLDERRPLPWSQFAQIILSAKEDLDERTLDAFLVGVREQNAWDEVLSCKEVAHWHRELKDRQTQLNIRQAAELTEKLKSLKDRLQYFRANRMFEEEAATLDQLRALFPDEPEFAHERQDVSERWAREILSARATSPETDLTDELWQQARQLTPEQISIKDLLVVQCLERAKQKPHAAYDLALLLVFMEFYNEAIEVLELAPSSPPADWLRLDLQLRARQYVAALDEANTLELAYAGDPASTFAVAYARARALWGLGQGTLAIDLMRSIVNVRPNYKAAVSLLADWSGGRP